MWRILVKFEKFLTKNEKENHQGLKSRSLMARESAKYHFNNDLLCHTRQTRELTSARKRKQKWTRRIVQIFKQIFN